RWRVAPGAVEVREADELGIASIDLIGCERAQPLDAKGLTGERAQDIAMDQRLPVVQRPQLACARQPAGEMAQETAREGVACTSWVAHLFKRIGRGGEEAAVRAEHHRAIRALLDDQQLWAALQN